MKQYYLSVSLSYHSPVAIGGIRDMFYKTVANNKKEVKEKVMKEIQRLSDPKLAGSYKIHLMSIGYLKGIPKNEIAYEI